MPNPLIEKLDTEFDEIIGTVPDRAIMQSYGKEFCVMCGHPTNADDTAKRLKSYLYSSYSSLIQAIENEVTAYVQEAIKDPKSDNYIYAEMIPLHRLNQILTSFKQ